MRLRFVKRWPIGQIAEMLQVSIKTIERDIQAIVECGYKIGADAMQEPLEQTVWEIMENYQERQMLRWQEFANAKDSKVKANILNDVGAEEERHYKLLQSMGVVLKTPEKLDVREVQTWADLAAMVEAIADEQNNDGGGENST
jgi:predicted DNA-binding transcriptional regulator YafY